MQLTPRQLKILSVIVELYIQTLEPVSSKAVCDRMDNSCSSATVRNEMAFLCEKGFIEQPHTSAGRIPSQSGYRLYVDRLMNRYSLSDEDKVYIDSLLPASFDSVADFMHSAGNALAEMTDCASFSTTPVDNGAVIRSVELFPLSPKKYLMVLMTEQGIIKNRVCGSLEPLKREQLEHFSKALCDCYKGKTFSEVDTASAQRAAAQLSDELLSFSQVLDEFINICQDAVKARVMFGGQENLFVHHELNPDGVHKLLSVIMRRDMLLKLLSGRSEKTSIVFGSETGQSELDPAGIISSFYNVGGKPLGRIGIIGPVRMDYVHIIPSIEYFADSLGKILGQSVNNDDWS